MQSVLFLERNNMTVQQKRGLSRNQIKWIAVVFMIVDHSTCALIDSDSVLYWILRMGPGRIAYPIFCTLFVEGFLYTKHPWWHVRDLIITGVVSEVFFNYAIYGQWVYLGHQNIMFSWAFSFMVMYLYSMLRKIYATKRCDILSYNLLNIMVLLLAMIVSEFMKLDYGAVGVMCVIIVYYLHVSKVMDKSWQLTLCAGIIDSCGIIWFLPMLAAPIMRLYDSDKVITHSKKIDRFVHKYLFYAIYPLHLAVLSCFRYIFL